MRLKTFTPDEPALPMNYPGFVLRSLREDGYPASALLTNTGLNEKQLEDPHFRCGFQPLRRFFLNAIAHTNDPHLGAHLALKFDPAYVGLPSYTAMNAACFQDGLEVLEQFFFLTFPAFDFSLVDSCCGPETGEMAIRLRSKFPFREIEYFGFSSALVAINGLLKAMLRSDQVATRAETTVKQPDGWSDVAQKLGFAVRFEASENRLLFPKDLLTQPLPGSDPINHAQLLVLCAQFAAGVSQVTTPVAQVMALLEGSESLSVQISEVAEELGYSERGLRRQLDRCGTSFRTLLDQAREQRARALLSGTSQPIKSITSILGFESSSNFARSFKRWTGLTPKAFRDQAHVREASGRK
ncbi:AraC-like DNA-binding protein [Roseibium hamelinense]|uniref:AraC-like DNA-binding protein n=1 Tax=Roseibium hamelinense TaxID=150831 RepID=A0A562SBX2_9HYPH|nr:AraC family transcriptional regulator [Roseibium hamelinense]MTI42086.1 AraC family transcriptional regulator [Roseibium hamelinense]TWI78698.1 AraC-like DNA-binding protein [Roseibium hamelinense]